MEAGSWQSKGTWDQEPDSCLDSGEGNRSTEKTHRMWGGKLREVLSRVVQDPTEVGETSSLSTKVKNGITNLKRMNTLLTPALGRNDTECKGSWTTDCWAEERPNQGKVTHAFHISHSVTLSCLVRRIFSNVHSPYNQKRSILRGRRTAEGKGSQSC